MHLRLLGLAVFVGLSVIIGTEVLALEIGVRDSRAVLALGVDSADGKSGKSASLPVNAADQENRECPPESPSVGYNPSLQFNAKYCAGPKSSTPPKPPVPSPVPVPTQNKTVVGAAIQAISCIPPQTMHTNAFGKPCTYSHKLAGYVVDSKCFAPNTCRAHSFTGQDGKKYAVSGEPTKSAGPATPKRTVSLPPPVAQPVSAFSPSPYPTGPKSGDIDPKSPALDSSPAAPLAPAPVTPAARISDIASGGGQAPGPVNGPRSLYESAPQTFSPSPRFSSSPSRLGSLFGGGGSGSGGGYSGGAYGTIAYVPVNQYPGLTSPNFDTRGTGITFPKPKPSPLQILARLAQDTTRAKTGRAPARSLEDRGVIGGGILETINSLVMPTGKFIQSFFSSGDVGIPSVSEVYRVEQEKRLPLERGSLVLSLAPGDTLVAGDPRESLTGRSDREYEAFESISSSNRVWVENAPRAVEGIEAVANAPPTYGWGESLEGGRDGRGEEYAPQVSDVSFEPSLSYGIIPEIAGDESVEKPRSFFPVMVHSFGAIAEAVVSLFANIGKALFWWL